MRQEDHVLSVIANYISVSLYGIRAYQDKRPFFFLILLSHYVYYHSPFLYYQHSSLSTFPPASLTAEPQSNLSPQTHS
jgi:hypothetical protein